MTRRRAGLAALVVPALLALSACNAGSQIVVHPDGSGTFSTVMTVEGAAAGDALYQSVAKAEADSTVPLTVTHYTSGTESGAKIAVPFRSLTDLTALGTSLGSSTGLAGVAVTKAASGWTFVAHSDEGLVRPPGSAAGAPGGSIDGSQMAGLVHMSVAVELPGAPGRTNASTATRTATTTRFVWNLAVGRAATDLKAATTFVGDQRSVTLATELTALKTPTAPAVSAASAHKDGATSRASIAVAVAAVLLAAAFGLLFLRRRRARVRPGT